MRPWIFGLRGAGAVLSSIAAITGLIVHATTTGGPSRSTPPRPAPSASGSSASHLYLCSGPGFDERGSQAAARAGGTPPVTAVRVQTTSATVTVTWTFRGHVPDNALANAGILYSVNTASPGSIPSGVSGQMSMILYFEGSSTWSASALDDGSEKSGPFIQPSVAATSVTTVYPRSQLPLVPASFNWLANQFVQRGATPSSASNVYCIVGTTPAR